MTTACAARRFVGEVDLVAAGESRSCQQQQKLELLFISNSYISFIHFWRNDLKKRQSTRFTHHDGGCRSSTPARSTHGWIAWEQGHSFPNNWQFNPSRQLVIWKNHALKMSLVDTCILRLADFVGEYLWEKSRGWWRHCCIIQVVIIIEWIPGDWPVPCQVSTVAWLEIPTNICWSDHMCNVTIQATAKLKPTDD